MGGESPILNFGNLLLSACNKVSRKKKRNKYHMLKHTEDFEDATWIFTIVSILFPSNLIKFELSICSD